MRKHYVRDPQQMISDQSMFKQLPHLEIVFLGAICNILHINISINELKLDFDLKNE